MSKQEFILMHISYCGELAMKLPHQIIKKSPKWHYNSWTGEYIHKDNLKAYIAAKAQLKLKI